MSNARCKKHNEIEPQDHDILQDDLWSCPKCSRESMKWLAQPDENGRKPLDVALDEIEKRFGSKK